jgi:RNA ligase
MVIMRYDFPSNITLEEVTNVIARHNERTGTTAFIKADRGDHFIFNYLISFPGAFPFPNTGDEALDREYAILRECRGLTFSADGTIIARKFAKFFNVNEKPESQIDVIDWSQPHRVLEKLDGSMITPMIVDGEVRWCTKMGLTDVAKPVDEFVKKNPIYERLARACIDQGVTAIFEWCSRQQRIVVDYPEDRLVLLAIRDNLSGQYWTYEQMSAIQFWDGEEFLCDATGIEIVRALPGSAAAIQQFMAEVHDMEGLEGYIIRFDDGRMYKVKGLWYCQIHRTKDFLQHEKDVLAMICHDTVDDVLPFMDENDRVAVLAYQAAYEAAVAEEAEWLTDEYAALKNRAGDDKKAFAQTLNAAYSKSPFLHMMFELNKGGSSVEVIKGVIKKAVHPTAGTQARVDGIRYLIGDLKWSDFKYASLPEE